MTEHPREPRRRRRGSIAGCAAAVALHRAGCTVEVYERSRQELRDRGSGMLMPIPPARPADGRGRIPLPRTRPHPDRRVGGHAHWAIYTAPPPGLDFTEPISLAPGEVTADMYSHPDALLAQALPPEMQALIRRSPREEVSIQPIYDEIIDTYARGRVLLIGDAGTVTRPCGHGDWEPAMHAYNEERVGAGTSIVEAAHRARPGRADARLVGNDGRGLRGVDEGDPGGREPLLVGW